MPGAAPVLLLDVGANVSCRPEHLVQFAHMGSAFAQAVMGITLAAGRAAVERRGARQGHARAGRGPRAARRRGRHRSELRRQRRGDPGHRRRRRRGRDGRVHRQHHAEADRGRLGPHAARDSRCRDELDARQARRLAAAPRRSRSCARRSIPRARAAPTCSACASSASSPTAGSRARGLRARDRGGGARASQEDVIGRTRDGARAGRRAAARPARISPRTDRCGRLVRAGGYGVRPMTREQVFAADPRPPRRRARGGSGLRSTSRRASERTSRPIRWTCTRWSRSSRTPTA